MDIFSQKVLMYMFAITPMYSIHFSSTCMWSIFWWLFLLFLLVILNWHSNNKTFSQKTCFVEKIIVSQDSVLAQNCWISGFLSDFTRIWDINLFGFAAIISIFSVHYIFSKVTLVIVVIELWWLVWGVIDYDE